MTTIPEDAHVKRSKLINDFLQEVRAIEKELRKKKLPAKQKETLEAKLELLREEHTARLNEFDTAQGIISKEAAETGSHTSHTSHTPAEPVSYEERNWGSLSKRELEDECIKRGLSRKGGKEDLITRLNIFTLDHKSKTGVSSGGVSSGGVSTVSTVSPVKAAIKYETVIPSGPSTKQDYRNKNKKLWKRRGPPKDARKTSSSSESEGDGDSDEEEEEEEEFVNKKELSEEKQKQLKREKLIQGVLTNILKKYAKGIEMDEMPNYLERFKVKNFSPAALGYKDVEEWIINQPRDVLSVDKKSKLVYPPRDDYDSDSGSDDSDSDDSGSDDTE